MHRSPAERPITHLMRSDAALPADLVPEAMPNPRGHALLVTGATGFLGRYLVRELLQRPEPKIFCLVRAANDSAARQRLAVALKAAGVDPSAHAGQVHVLAGATDQPQLGLSDRAYRRLSIEVGAIYHCAATVNWALGYRRLRTSNVLGTVELIRLACTGTLKRLYFSSTIAVCFAIQGPDEVDENTDMLPYLEYMPLGYAQSKCVAESLLRAAANRGVPVSIIRPALICGDSNSGDCKNDDLISALIQGCVASKSAIDSDWRLDCIPVDYVAQVLARLGESSRPGWEVLNLFNERGRHWREIVLWMNLYGYPVQLVSHGEWLRRTFDRTTAPASLFGYRRFFGAASTRFPGPPPYETYLAQGRVRNELTRQTLKALDLDPPRLDTALLERYFEHYVAVGSLPPGRHRPGAVSQRSARSTLQQAIQSRLVARNITVLDILERPFGSSNGIFNEISATRLGGHIGIRRYDVLVREPNGAGQRTLNVLLKSKPSDTLMENLLVEVATLCDPSLGANCEAFKADLGLAGCHERELALYEVTEPRLRRVMPLAFGTHRDLAQGTWSIAMEYLAAAETVDVASATGWRCGQVGGILRGLADVHAIWYRQDAELSRLPWLAPPIDTARMTEMSPLWNGLARYSSPVFSRWLNEPTLPLQNELISGLQDWWPELRALPQTLVHNDFNPRNLVLRNTATGPEPVIFDWELATVNVPQHDVAELLCFVVPLDLSLSALSSFLELHRHALESAVGVPVDRGQWLRGFVLSLRYLMINRLPLYTLMHRFKPQTFLPRVICNWRRLYQLSNELALRTPQDSHRQPGNYQNYRSAEKILGPHAQKPTYVEPEDVGQVWDV